MRFSSNSQKKKMENIKTLTIEKKLGSGLYAEVYLARDETLDRNVAVKIIRDEFSQEDSIAVSHAKTLAALQRHTNLVQVYSVGEVNLTGMISKRSTVIEMEWINGENLHTKLKGLRFTVPECRKLCLGIKNGIAHMHSGKMAHGDLHPGNILVDDDSNAIVIDAANRHNITAFRTTYANVADLFEQDLRSLKFCVRLIISHTMISPAIAGVLMQKVEDATSIEELSEIFEGDNDWFGSHSGFAVTNLSPSYSTPVIQLIENDQSLTLRETALGSVNRLVMAATDERVAPMDSVVDQEAINARIEYFERISADTASMLGLVAAWGKDESHERIELDSFRLLKSHMNVPYTRGVYKKDWETMRHYPLLILFYSSCFAAYRNGRFSFLKHFLTSPSENKTCLLDAINISTIDLEIAWREIAKTERYTPVSDRIVNLLPSLVPSFALSDQTTADDFDELQAFLSCVLIDQSYPGNLAKADAGNFSRSCALKGRFLWRFERSSYSREIENYLIQQARREGVNWGPIRHGFFGGTLERALQVLEFSKIIHNQMRQAYRIF
jgi:hypothetical protein